MKLSDMRQASLFKHGPSRPSAAPRRSVPPRPMVIDPFDFGAADDPRTDPQPDAAIPEEIRLPTDDPLWMPGKA